MGRARDDATAQSISFHQPTYYQNLAPPGALSRLTAEETNR